MTTKTQSAGPPNSVPVTQTTIESIGHASAKIQVELSTRFLEHFSEHMYSSPQKAFEELISNGWDAGADYVDVRIAADLTAVESTLSVLDNGVSMDEAGLRQLWHIAFSPKKAMPVANGRPVVGKFGLGKLATYVLANKLTYLCKAADGIIRRVTMDFGAIDKHSDHEKLISDLDLDVFEVTEAEMKLAVGKIDGGGDILELISKGMPKTSPSSDADEFGGDVGSYLKPPVGTWTLVILSDLKRTGRELKAGVLARMLGSALPFGAQMSIFVNGKALSSTKLSIPVSEQWVIGPALEIDSFDVTADAAADETVFDSGLSPAIIIRCKSEEMPFPHMEIPGIGVVTGRVTLFEDKVTGGKSDERGASNGFHVNVLGRVVNQADPTFGEENLSHAAWSRFRMTVRADGLNSFLTTDREKFRDTQELRTFRAFLRKVFNMVRSQYDRDEKAMMPDGGDVLVQSLGVLSLAPLRNVVSEALDSDSGMPGLFDERGVVDRPAKRKSWREETSENIKTALNQVRYEKVDDGSFVKFRLSDSSIIVNKEHPFVSEHSRSRAEKELVRTIAMVNLLSDVYALDIGVEESLLKSIMDYRDRLLRFRSLQRRQSGTLIAKLLLQMQKESAKSYLLEAALSDALRYLGFDVRDLAQSGEPEGIAKAFPMPTLANPTNDNPLPPLYSFTFDAKSSKHTTAATGNIKLDGIVEHRDRYKADYALVVAPGFEEGALSTRCEQQKVTPVRAADLGRLLEYTVEYGAIPLTKLRELFALFDPKKVTDWVTELGPWITKKRPLTMAIFLKALDNLKGQVPDVVSAGVISLECRRSLGAKGVKDEDVIAVAKGLAILIPDLVGVEGDKIAVNASAAKVAAAVTTQLEQLHDLQALSPENPGARK